MGCRTPVRVCTGSPAAGRFVATALCCALLSLTPGCGDPEERASALVSTAAAPSNADRSAEAGGAAIAEAAARALEDAGSVHVVTHQALREGAAADDIAMDLFAQDDRAVLRLVLDGKSRDLLVVDGACTWSRVPGESNGPGGYWALPWMGAPTSSESPLGP